MKAVTDDKITMSAGLALFSPSYPISQMAAITGLLESAAKDNTGKDSIALFGFETNTMVKNVYVVTYINGMI